jgi:hypothetical protein
MKYIYILVKFEKNKTKSGKFGHYFKSGRDT